MSFIVIEGRAAGGNGNPIELVWCSDFIEKRTMKEAIRHGLKTVGCDDFRIGQKRGEWLKSLSWMGSKLFGPDEIRKVADCLGMKNYWDEPDDGLGIGWGT